MDKNFNIFVTQNKKFYNVVVTQNFKRYTVNYVNGVNEITVETVSATSGTIITGPPGPQGPIGPAGPAGPQGPQGDDIFEVWLIDNPGGTIDDFLDTITGPAGPQGPQGNQGNNGISAYQVALNNGFVGTESDWLISLQSNNTLEQARSLDDQILGNIDANGNKIVNSANGSAAQDLVTVNQMDALEATLRAYAEAISVSNFRLLGDYDIVGLAAYPSPPAGSGTSGAVRRGDGWRVNVAGNFDGKTYEVGDIVYATTGTPGQVTANWSSLDYNQQQAIESAAGVAKICTLAEIQNENSTNNTDIVTPTKFWSGIGKMITLAWTWTLKQTFTAAPRFNSVVAGKILKTNGSNDLTEAIANTDYVEPNLPIVGGTGTKVTYDAKGLVTGSVAATTTDINEGTNLYFTDTRARAAIGASQIVITTAVSIDTTTTDGTLSQNGRNVIIDNGANAINYTVNATSGFIASYIKHGTGAITFVQGAGRTLVQVNGTAILNGAVGSSATISSVGTTDYLKISNA